VLAGGQGIGKTAPWERGLRRAGERGTRGAAAQAGFADQSHLTRWFTRCYGVTPGAYQRATRAA
jgi:transcriptional regulator GlxA family with amidase domain